MSDLDPIEATFARAAFHEKTMELLLAFALATATPEFSEQFKKLIAGATKLPGADPRLASAVEAMGEKFLENVTRREAELRAALKVMHSRASSKVAH